MDAADLVWRVLTGRWARRGVVGAVVIAALWCTPLGTALLEAKQRATQARLERIMEPLLTDLTTLSPPSVPSTPAGAVPAAP